ncbi:MAG TPA: prephenate dehydratase [Clostridia bacterium]|nr:prephenate dehydratase [Clostridia bacterium]
MIKIGYLGPRGTFSFEAMKKYTVDGQYEAQDYQSIPEIILAVQDGKLEEAIVPIENSIEGAVNATMDMIAMENGLMIKAELVLPIREHLLVKTGTDISGIRFVLSHPQPLGQCRRFLSEQLPQAQVKSAYSTSAAAQEVAEGGNELAAIGSAAAAAEYGLEIAKSDIQDHSSNHTRFIVVGRNDAKRSGNDKTSIVFSTEDKPGSLYRVLDIFNLWDINMARIESRPAKHRLGRYIFFVDLLGHREDGDMRDALTMVKRKTSFLKILGSYPIFQEPTEGKQL